VGRAIDYLQTLPFVDPKRIGSIGHSHGAYGTLFPMAVEPRLRIGIASCGFTSFRTDPGFDRWYRRTALMPRLGFFEGRVQDTPLDVHHLLALIAPRPLFISGALKDSIFPGTENLPWIVEQVRSAYALYGLSETFDAYIFDGEHRFTPEARDRAYAFLDRHLGASHE
jgi:dienelactone hydrolase